MCTPPLPPGEIPLPPHSECFCARVLQVEKHWTEKSLEEMTERDWRIFREDFNISYKGTNTVLPMRNWEELNLPKEIRKVRGSGLHI